MRALLRHEREHAVAAVVQRLDLDRAPDFLAGEDADEVVRAGDRSAVERQDDVAGDEPRRSAGLPGSTLAIITALSWVRPAACRRRRESVNCWAAIPI